MYHRLRLAIIRNVRITLVRKKGGFRYTRFSRISGTWFDHQKMWCRPTRTIRSRSTNATGRKATYPSRKRMIGRDQRAVVMRCTATNITPADDTDVK